MFKSRILFYKHQVPDRDEMLEKWPGCKTNIHWLKKPTEKKGNLTSGGELLNLDGVSSLKAGGTVLIREENYSNKTQQD